MIGHDRVIELRQRGHKPTTLFVDFGLPSGAHRASEDSFPSITVSPAEIGSAHDLRFLIGLNVVVCSFVEPGAALFRFLEACADAGAAQVLCCVDGDILRFVRGRMEVLG